MQNTELERLQNLLPEELVCQVAIAPAIKHLFVPISTRKVDARSYVIQVDERQWQKISLDCRNLLLWHEVACIQQHSITSDNWSSIAFAIALGMSAMEVASQQVWMLSIYLLLTLLAGWQCYQNRFGESSLRVAAKGDRGAILLAQQFGYSLPEARDSLLSALKFLLQSSPRGFLAKQYRTRLQVLQIKPDSISPQ